MSSVFKNFRAKFPRISQPAHEPAPRRKLPFATQAAREGQCGGILVSQNLRNRFTAARHARGRPCTTSVLRRIKNGYCSRLCLSGMQIQVLKYLRKTRAKRAQKTAANHMRKGEFPYIFPSLSEISVPQRQAGFKQTAIPRHSAPTAAEREAKAPITTRCLCRTRCQIPALSQSVRARKREIPCV